MQAPGQPASANNSGCHYKRCYRSSRLRMRSDAGESLPTAVTAARRAERGDTQGEGFCHTPSATQRNEDRFKHPAYLMGSEIRLQHRA